MNRILVWCFVVSLSGFLFGFDIIVISGVDQSLQSLWDSSDLFHGFVVMGTALWGTVVGAMFGGVPSKRIGRKYSLILIGFLFLLSAIGSALSNDPYTFSIFRFIGGLGVGASTIAAPAYLSEISSNTNRGRNVAFYQLSIVIGILFAMGSNYLLHDFSSEAWRWMLGVEAIPALIFSLLIFTVPRSPRWLISRGRIEEAKAILSKKALNLNLDQLIKQVRLKDEQAERTLFSPAYRKTLYLLFFIAFFNQWSGINAVLYYAPRIFEIGGLERSAALLGGVGIGFFNLIFTFLGMKLIDSWGRKKLMYAGTIGYLLSLSMLSIYFSFQIQGVWLAIFLFIFIASHAIGQGTVIWVFLAEILPTSLRSGGQAFGSSVHWILAALIPSMIPYLFNMIGAAAVFALFAAFMLAQLAWVYYYMPETKGRSLEGISSSIES